MAATFTQTGGARIGVFNATWPFARIKVTESELRLRCFWKSWTFAKGQIIRLSEYGTTGLRIEHSIERYTRFIVFWTFRFSKLKCALEENGYKVHE